MAELLEQIQSEFDKQISGNNKIAAFYKKLEDGKATYEDASTFSVEVGNILSKIYEGSIDESVLTDGTLTKEVAESIIPEPLRNNYNIISSATEQIQTTLNENAGIGIKALVPEYNADRVNGIEKHVTSKPYDNIKASFLDSIVNYSQNVVDQSIKKNADFQYKSGMVPAIERSAEWNACKWCRSLAKLYEYPDVPDDVYSRHENCRCTVEYDPKSGKGKQNVWTKAWNKTKKNEKESRIEKTKLLDNPVKSDIIEARKQVGISDNHNEYKRDMMK